jgi:hypothetical protein
MALAPIPILSKPPKNKDDLLSWAFQITASIADVYRILAGPINESLNRYVVLPILSTTGSSPADVQTYYFGLGSGFGTATTQRRILIHKPGIVKRVYLQEFCTVGSNEDSTLYLRRNNSSDTLLTSTLKFDASGNYIDANNLSINLAADDWLQVKWVCPTWATNPTNVVFFGLIYVE